MEENTPRILIVDDDIDFASLLSDVFSQASYEVETISDPTTVEKIVKEKDFNLVVTDLRMPGIDGFELARKVKAIKPDLPIIMVSGFLDAKDRERMEAEGIVGLYEKPLSVFSLLKNAAKLIAEGKGKTPGDKSQSKEEDSEKSSSSNLGFPFGSLPCRSDASRTFAESIYRLRNRRPNLSIITPRGIPARAVAEDFCRWINSDKEGGRVLDPADCNEKKLAQIAEEAGAAGWENLVLCVPEADHLDPIQQKALAKGLRKGAFREKWDGHIRVIFMIGSDVESLYQEASLSDELYLAMGGSELQCPPLRECPEDIEFIARSTKAEDGTPLQWTQEAIASLTEREWPGNHSELRKTLLFIQQDYSGDPVSLSVVMKALSEGDTKSTPTTKQVEKSLFESLEACRSSYLQALAELTGEDAELIATLTKAPKELVERMMVK